jgi:hypothetical protein
MTALPTTLPTSLSDEVDSMLTKLQLAKLGVDRIVRIFAYWAIVNFGQCFGN